MPRTFATAPSFLGAAFFLVTPAGFTGFTPGSAAGFFALGLVVRLMAGAVSTAWKTRGRELPVADRVPSRGISDASAGDWAAKARWRVRARRSRAGEVVWHVLRHSVQTRTGMRHEDGRRRDDLQLGASRQAVWLSGCPCRCPCRESDWAVIPSVAKALFGEN